MRLRVAVQHHPSRAELLPALLDRLGDAEVIEDPDPDSPIRSALRTYLECHRRRPARATHYLIVQDDAWPCDDFRERAEDFVACHSDTLCALFVPRAAGPGGNVRRALRSRENVAWIREGWTPTVALAWPQEASESFLAYAQERYGPEARADDSPVGAWRRVTKWRCVAPIPSLVEHPDLVPSLYHYGKYGRGTNRSRKAAVFEDLRASD